MRAGILRASFAGRSEWTRRHLPRMRRQGLARHNIDRCPGRRILAYGAALGHAILAFLPEAVQIEDLESAERVKHWDRTLVDLDALLERLRQVKKQGYAISDGENAFGLRTVAVPAFDASNRPEARVSLSVYVQRMSRRTGRDSHTQSARDRSELGAPFHSLSSRRFSWKVMPTQ